MYEFNADILLPPAHLVEGVALASVMGIHPESYDINDKRLADLETAYEVRALAQRTAEAASDITTLIAASTSHVGEGVTLVGETGTLLEGIVDQIGNMNTQIDDIASMATSQATNLEQVNSSVEMMDQMTQRSAAMVEETTAAARTLSDEAARLQQMVSQFRTSGDEAASTMLLPATVPAAAPAPAFIKAPVAQLPVQKAPPAPALAAASDGNLALDQYYSEAFDLDLDSLLDHP